METAVRAAALAAVIVVVLAPSATAQVRDASAPAADRPAGTHILTGRVVEAQEPSHPVRRAWVTLSASGSEDRRTVTDDDGRFAFEGLGEGRYIVTATKAAYLPAAFGATRPGRQGTSVAVGGEPSVPLTIVMWRGAVIEGRLTDDRGRAVADTPVYALSTREDGAIWEGRASAQDPPTARTDDRGVYRIFGLSPGEYVVGALLSVVGGPIASIAGGGEIEQLDDGDVDAAIARRENRGTGAPQPMDSPRPHVGFPLTYFPGVVAYSRARPVTVRAGDERLGIDFILQAVPTAEVSGTVSRSDGGRLHDVGLSLVLEGPRVFSSSSRPVLLEDVGTDGRFRYSSLPPGRHRIYAKSVEDAAGGPPLLGYADVDVYGGRVEGVALVLQPGLTISGQVVLDTTSGTLPVELSPLRVRAVMPGGGWSFVGDTRMGNGIVSPSPMQMRQDGSFDLTGLVAGDYTLQVTLPPQQQNIWWVRSAMFGGRDLLDGPFEVADRDLTGVVVTVTDRHSELFGTLETAAGLPAPEYHIVALPADPALRRPGSRRIRMTRPGSDGVYSIRDLPGGDYLLVALTDLLPEDLEDPSLLADLAASGVAVRVVDGETVSQNLRISR